MLTELRAQALLFVGLVGLLLVGMLAVRPALSRVHAGITPSPVPTATPTLAPPTETSTPVPPTETPTSVPPTETPAPTEAPTDTPAPGPEATATPGPTPTEVPVTIPETGGLGEMPLFLMLGGAGLMGVFLVMEGSRRVNGHRTRR